MTTVKSISNRSGPDTPHQSIDWFKGKNTGKSHDHGKIDGFQLVDFPFFVNPCIQVSNPFIVLGWGQKTPLENNGIKLMYNIYIYRYRKHKHRYYGYSYRHIMTYIYIYTCDIFFPDGVWERTPFLGDSLRPYPQKTKGSQGPLSG